MGPLIAPNGTDVNTVSVSGLYRYDTGSTNKPAGSNYGTVIAQIYSTSNPLLPSKVLQFTDIQTGKSWIRSQINGGAFVERETLTDVTTGTVVTSDITTSATDTTAGRVTKVGDFGLGADAIISNNFDIITDSGFYGNSSSTAIGLPVASNVILMVHNERSNNYAVQTAVQINTNRSWNRSKSVNNWTSWVEILTESSTINAATLDNLDSTQFLRSDVSDSYSNGILAAIKDAGVTIAGSLGQSNGIEIYQPTVGGSSDAFMTFHVAGQVGMHFGAHGASQKLSVGGWTYGSNVYAIYHEGNKPTASDLDVVPNKGATNWASGASPSGSVVGMLGWKNFGNNHVIFDASQSTSPTGTTVNNTNSTVPWADNYPTLMGWNGVDTYGVRVDSARNADTLDSLDSTQFLRSDANDTVTGHITFNDNYGLRFGTGNDAQFFCNGSHLYTDLKAGIGNWYIRDGTTTRFTFDDAGHFTATGNVTAYSDERLKTDLVQIDNALDKVSTLTGYTYNRQSLDGELEDTPRQAGLLASDIEKVLPEVVQVDPEDEDAIKSVAYGNMAALFVEAIKELKAENTELKARLDNAGL